MRNKLAFLILFLVLCFPACYPRVVGLDTFIFMAIVLNVFFVAGMLILLAPWPKGFAKFSYPKLMASAYSLFVGIFVSLVGSTFLNGMIYLTDNIWDPFYGFEGLGLWTPITFVLIYAFIFFETDFLIARNKILGCLVAGTMVGLPGMISAMGWSLIELDKWHIRFSDQLIAALIIAMAVRVGVYLTDLDYPETEEDGHER